jgi:hypothetical protein
MARIPVVLVLIALLSLTASAQLVRDHTDAGEVRGFHGPGSSGRIKRSFQSDAEARAEFGRILSAVGLSWITDRVTLRASAETDNAEAGIAKNGERFIFYNAAFMQKVKQKTADHWSLVSILAHEVGHHLAFHTEIEGRWHEFELEADYFSGFVLRRLGATLDQAHAAMRAIAPKQASQTHPGLDQRLQAIAIGWTDGGAQGTPRGLKKADEAAALAVPPAARPEPPPAQASMPDMGNLWRTGRLAGLAVLLDYGRDPASLQAGRALARLLREVGGNVVPPGTPADIVVRQQVDVRRSEAIGKREAAVTINVACSCADAAYVLRGAGEGPDFEIAIERALQEALRPLERQLRGMRPISRP